MVIRALMLIACLGACTAGTVTAQEWKFDARTPASSGVSAFQPSPLDVSLVRTVNGWNAPAFRIWMQGADRSAYTGMFGSVPAWWAASAFTDRVESKDALGFTLAWVSTAGVVWAGKRLLARPRPYTVLDGLAERGGRRALDDRSSMPSGHAALSAVSATWVILAYPDGPAPWLAGVWAVSVGTSRVWKGVHYPSDVLVGMALGVGAGLLVHHIQ